ncbi:MAG TPA: hypothetical protein VGM44_23610 [Polyangiaceae bacterium]
MDHHLKDETTNPNPADTEGQSNVHDLHGRTPKRSPGAHRYRTAYEQVFDRSRSLDQGELVAVNIDIPNAVVLVVGIAPAVRALRGKLAQLPEFELENVDLLETYAQALGHAHAQMTIVPARIGTSALKQEALALRDILLADAAALEARRLISTKALKEVREECRSRLAFGLLNLATLLRTAWPKIAGRPTIAQAELNQVETLVDRLMCQPDEQESVRADASARSEQRQRNFTLLVRAYEQVRRGVAYFHWSHGEVDCIVPSLYRGRVVRSRTSRASRAAKAKPETQAEGARAASQEAPSKASS